MVTEIINAIDEPLECIQRAVSVLNSGKIVAFPTETIYGVGVDLFNEEAIQTVFRIKNRPFSKPLAAHVCSIEMAESILESPSEIFYKLAKKYLPGPLSIVSRKKTIVPNAATAAGDTVAIRFPDCKLAIDLINLYGKPLAATSANLSGGKFAVNAIDVYKSMKSLIPLILDGGTSKFERESTLISIVDDDIKILREGVIPGSEILAFLNQ